MEKDLSTRISYRGVLEQKGSMMECYFFWVREMVFFFCEFIDAAYLTWVDNVVTLVISGAVVENWGNLTVVQCLARDHYQENSMYISFSIRLLQANNISAETHRLVREHSKIPISTHTALAYFLVSIIKHSTHSTTTPNSLKIPLHHPSPHPLPLHRLQHPHPLTPLPRHPRIQNHLPLPLLNLPLHALEKSK